VRSGPVLGEATPAVLITGDTSTDLLKTAHQNGLVVLHKPLHPDISCA